MDGGIIFRLDAVYMFRKMPLVSRRLTICMIKVINNCTEIISSKIYNEDNLCYMYYTTAAHQIFIS